MKNNLFVPAVGQDIYVPTVLFMSHGRDDRRGGLAKVVDVFKGMSGGEQVWFVRVEPFPSVQMNWEQHLVFQQEKLRSQFGDSRARRDPDYDPHFNEA